MNNNAHRTPHELRRSTRESFRHWRKAFFPKEFRDVDSPHICRLLTALESVAAAPLSGFCVMPRGAGTTTTLNAFAAWCGLEGHAESVTHYNHGSRICGPIDWFRNEAETNQTLRDAYGFDRPIGRELSYSEIRDDDRLGNVGFERANRNRLTFLHDDGRRIQWIAQAAKDAPRGHSLDFTDPDANQFDANEMHIALIDAPAVWGARGAARLSTEPNNRCVAAGVPPEQQTSTAPRIRPDKYNIESELEP